ncbi:translation initiation factor eIF 4e-like domain-containing protein [Vararia minispora EC-137]|uniref:Translation initiation factor eIF 4e-like domain-containing protein n=1 Tax=Vararia minispora EC-137 TaxID=1314806 RepID=A0ACB8Q6L6_9AGAM|nr:translation initiation factor eIF 4e-like domain-containing protein [Vararia minispora EC-137]
MSTPPPVVVAAPPASTDKPEQPSRPSSKRPPSLNELAARIGAAAPAAPAASRPRLAASLLRTGSSASSGSATTTDSTAVLPPTTRSTSPTALSASPPGSVDGDAAAAGEPLTQERVEQLPAAPKKGIKGYKNIPSLDAITAHYARTRTLSVDGSPVPPEAEQIEDPKTPGVMTKAPEHPLQHTWTIYHDTKSKAPFAPSSATDPSFPAPAEAGDYEAGLTTIGEFDTVESYCRYFNWLKPPSRLERNSNYHLFKSGIKPMWEDAANARGGKWVLTMRGNPVLLDRCWQWLTMALVGEELDEGDEICGAVVSLRAKVDRIQLWTRSKDDVAKINSIGRKLVKLLDVSEADGIGLEFQYNTEDRPLPNKFLSIQAVPVSGFRPSFHTKAGSTSAAPSPVAATDSSATAGNAPVAPAAPSGGGGAFAGFGVGGLGGGGGAWRARRA